MNLDWDVYEVISDDEAIKAMKKDSEYLAYLNANYEIMRATKEAYRKAYIKASDNDEPNEVLVKYYKGLYKFYDHECDSIYLKMTEFL